MAERYYEFLSREEVLDSAPIDHLPIAPEHRRILQEAHLRMSRFLVVATVPHLGYDGQLKEGQLVAHQDVMDVLWQRFDALIDEGFAIEKIKPHVLYGYDDNASMADNNTSGQRPSFLGDPTRLVLSKHFGGLAVDIEPVHNKQRDRNGLVVPPYVDSYVERPESMLMYNLPVRLGFSDVGWEYGGTWPVAGIEKITGHPDFYPGAPADEHHFELRDAKLSHEIHLLDMSDITFPDGIEYEHPGRIRATFAA